jgi:methylase of polypeptide subunit release factors
MIEANCLNEHMSSVPCVPAHDIVGNLARFIVQVGYTEAEMKNQGLTKVPWRKSGTQSLLKYKLVENTPLNLLVRLFWFGQAVSADEISSTLPPEIFEGLLRCGLAERDDDVFVPNCMLVHFENLLLACDSVRRAQARIPDLVLGVSTPTKLLANSLISVPDATVLDLGTGCGTLALVASRSARSVLATDINPRALAFTTFNAALNGVTNVQVSLGDRFEPAGDQQFDVIACNPPFFITPKPRLLYTENSDELDSFVESLARTAPRFLKDGGFFQMLCEWVAFQGDSWRSRLTQWFEGSGCDALILKAYEMNPADYTLTRAVEAASLHGEASENMLLEHVEYFTQRRVEKIFGGLVTLRCRKAKNWFLCEGMDDLPDQPIGGLLMNRFATEDILSSYKDSELLTLKPKLCGGVQLVQESTQENQSWRPKRIFLESRTGLVKRLAFDRAVADLVVRFDGKQALGRLLTELAKQSKLSREQAVDNGLRLVRKLSSLGLITLNS